MVRTTRFSALEFGVGNCDSYVTISMSSRRAPSRTISKRESRGSCTSTGSVPDLVPDSWPPSFTTVMTSPQSTAT
jgi:hypothetical protein